MSKLRAYYGFYGDGSEGSEACVAENTKEAKNIIREKGTIDGEFIDLRVKWIKGANIEGLDKGLVGLEEGLKRGMYYEIWDYECSVCHEERTVHYSGDIIACGECLEAKGLHY